MKKAKGMNGSRMGQGNLGDRAEEGEGIASSQFVGLKKDIERGSDRFWAKRGGDPNSKRSFNYGLKSG